MANIITILRVFLVFIVVYLLFRGDAYAYMCATGLTIIAFAMDGVDGYVARKFNETSKLGAVLDIMSDRIVENVYWVTFAALGWLSIVFPIIALTRSFVVDGLRSVAMEQGYTAFGETSMQSSKIGSFICSSKFSRISYAVAKMVAFIFMIIAKTPNLNFDLSDTIEQIAYFAAVIAISFCVIRGLPVVFESGKLLKGGSSE